MQNRLKQPKVFVHTQSDVYNMGLMMTNLKIQLAKAEKYIKFLKKTESQVCRRSGLFNREVEYEFTSNLKARMAVIDKILKCEPVTQETYSLLLGWKDLKKLDGIIKYPHVIPTPPKQKIDAANRRKAKL